MMRLASSFGSARCWICCGAPRPPLLPRGPSMASLCPHSSACQHLGISGTSHCTFDVEQNDLEQLQVICAACNFGLSTRPQPRFLPCCHVIA